MIIALLLGVLSGIITGLIPGIHVNLISVLVISFSTMLLQIATPIELAVYTISLALTHSFLDSIPSIYLGAPDEVQVLSVLPGHGLLHKGGGHNAIVYTLIGSLGTLSLGTLLFPLFIMSMNIVYPIIKDYIGYILIVIIAYMILRSKGKRLHSLAAFLLSGALGIFVLTGIPNLNHLTHCCFFLIDSVRPANCASISASSS